MAEPEPCERERERSRSPASRRGFWQAQLEAIYTRRNPAKMSTIPELLQKYEGQEAVLYAKVCHKYDLNPTKFHTEPDAWLEYDLTENHGAARDTTGLPVSAEPFDVTVRTLGGSTTTVSRVVATQTVKQLLKQAAEQLGFPPWSSRLCIEEKTLDPDKKLHAVNVAEGVSLVLVQEPEPELEKALAKFLDNQPVDAASVFVAHQVRRREGTQPASVLLGVFSRKEDAVALVAAQVKDLWGQVMLNAFENDDNAEFDSWISGAPNVLTIDVPFGDFLIWKIEAAIVR